MLNGSEIAKVKDMHTSRAVESHASVSFARIHSPTQFSDSDSISDTGIVSSMIAFDTHLSPPNPQQYM